jgi:hypothetical protein
VRELLLETDDETAYSQIDSHCTAHENHGENV